MITPLISFGRKGPYILWGFENGLKKCHQLLKNQGFLAVTEIVYLVNDPPSPLVQYFDSEYPDIKPVNDKIDLILNTRSRMLFHFTLPKNAWLKSLYLPMEKELNRLDKKYINNKVALDILEEMRNEINIYKKYSDNYGYEFFIMQKSD